MTCLLWSEVKGVATDDNVLTMDPAAFHGPRLDLPKARMKGKKRPQMMPLTDLALELLREVEEQRGAFGEHVFSNTAGRTSFAGWQTLMVRLRKRCHEMPQGWNIHDLRTGIATEMGDRLNAEESIIQRLLHHSSAARLGITWRYDQSRRLNPMLEALKEWQELLVKAVEEEKRRYNLMASSHQAAVITLTA
jgi:integrase